MTKTVRIYGVDVEFTDKAPTEDGLYWALDGLTHFQTVIDGGYSDTGYLPSEAEWMWSAPLVPKKGQP